MLCALIGTHVYFTFRLKFIQRKIPQGIKLSLFGDGQKGNGISAFSALATALAATIGTGNIIGISTAIAIGGPGAVFWCWITGVLGIATCYAECFLAVKYRVQRADGTYAGGPMYVMERVLGQKSAAILFSFAVVLVSLGMGSSVQSHSIQAALADQMPLSPNMIGVVTAVSAGFVILGGARQIAKACTCLVPFMTVFYFAGCSYLLWANRSCLGEALQVILSAAFSSRPVLGGVAGTLVMTAIRTGVSRGLFTNEAGLGSIPMAAASARTKSPYIQGLISMTGTFWDTVVMCAVTGIVIVSGMVREPESFRGLAEDRFCFQVFSGLPWEGEAMLTAALVLFAFATIIGWCYYGECAVRYLTGEKGLLAYQLLYIGAVYLGAVLSLEMVWMVSDIFNALMALPNLCCLWMMRHVVAEETRTEQMSSVSGEIVIH